MPEPTAHSRQMHFSQFFKAATLAVAAFALVPCAVQAQSQEVGKLREEAKKLKQPAFEDFEVARSDFKKKRAGIERLIFRGAASRADRLKVAAGLEEQMKLMTDPDLRRPQLQEFRDKFVKVLDRAGSLAPANQQEKIRREIFDMVTAAGEKMLDGNYYVREQVLVILGSLNVVPRTRPYAGSQRVLLKVARQSPFPEQRLLAMSGLFRLMRYSPLPANEEMEIAGVMAEELMKPGLADGDYYRLGYYLGFAGQTFDVVGNRKPSPTIALMHSMCDESRSWVTRAVAARSLGNTGDAANASGMQWPVIAWKVAEFARDAAVEFERQKAANVRNPANPVDGAALLDVFLAFKPDTQAGVRASRGLSLRSNDALVKGAFVRIVPLVSNAIDPKKGRIQKPDIDKLSDWLKKNVPQDLKYHRTAPPIPMKPQAGATPKNEQSSNAQSSTMPPGQ